jgi:nucleoid-associated protein YgaU
MHETHWHGYEPGPQGQPQPVVPNPAAEGPELADANAVVDPAPESAPTAAAGNAPGPGPLRRLGTVRRETRIVLAVGLSVGILVVALAVNQLRPRGKTARPSQTAATKPKAGKTATTTAASKEKPAPKPAPASPTLALNAQPPTPPPPTPIEPESQPEVDASAQVQRAPEPPVPVDQESPLLAEPAAVEPPEPLALDRSPTASGDSPSVVEPPLPASSSPVPEPLADLDTHPGTPPLPDHPPSPRLPPTASPSTPDEELPPTGEAEGPVAALPAQDPEPDRSEPDRASANPIAAETPPAAEPIPALTPAPATAPPSAPATPGPSEGGMVPLPHAGNLSELKVERLLGESRRTTPVPSEPPGAVAVSTPPADRVEPIRHVVQKGENFATIARLYYGSMRFYKALWKANQDVAPAPEKLYVGTTIRVPPPELLDPALIERPKPPTATVASSTTSARKDEQTRRTGQTGLVMLPHGKPARPSSEGEPIEAPTPTRTHVVKLRETLRSIARDQLGDARRESEILDLNLDVLGETAELRPGMRLRLPGDGSETRIR